MASACVVNGKRTLGCDAAVGIPVLVVWTCATCYAQLLRPQSEGALGYSVVLTAAAGLLPLLLWLPSFQSLLMPSDDQRLTQGRLPVVLGDNPRRAVQDSPFSTSADEVRSPGTTRMYPPEYSDEVASDTAATPPAVPLNSVYTGKNLFLTGVTGFVGKLVLEKALRTLPGIGRIYVLVRPRPGADPYERLQEVWSAPCFDVVRQQAGGTDAFDALVRTKVIPLPGDLMEDRFGMPAEEYEALAAQTHIILHLAATIDFTERLDVSINLNVLGTLRVLALARRAHALGVLHSVVHVSTAYVNSNRPAGSTVREELYPLPFHPREMCMRIMDMSTAEIDALTPGLLRQYGYPNTYTFTKAMAEHLAVDMAQGLPFAIFRPAIIGATLREPFPGWCDSASACGAVFLAVGLGVVQELQGDATATCDLVPVDHVINMLLVVAAHIAEDPATRKEASPMDRRSESRRDIRIFHCGTSSTVNAVVWGRVANALCEYWEKFPITASPSRIALLPWWRFELAFLLKRRLPSVALAACAALPGVPSSVQQQADRAAKLVGKLRKLADTFRSFVTQTWYFDTSNSSHLAANLATEDKETFCWDPLTIGWRAWVHNYCYGLIRYVRKHASAGDTPPVPLSDLAYTRLLQAMQ